LRAEATNLVRRILFVRLKDVQVLGRLRLRRPGPSAGELDRLV
jgi:hypothetical protein